MHFAQLKQLSLAYIEMHGNSFSFAIANPSYRIAVIVTANNRLLHCNGHYIAIAKMHRQLLMQVLDRLALATLRRLVDATIHCGVDCATFRRRVAGATLAEWLIYPDIFFTKFITSGMNAPTSHITYRHDL